MQKLVQRDSVILHLFSSKISYLDKRTKATHTLRQVEQCY